MSSARADVSPDRNGLPVGGTPDSIHGDSSSYPISSWMRRIASNKAFCPSRIFCRTASSGVGSQSSPARSSWYGNASHTRSIIHARPGRNPGSQSAGHAAPRPARRSSRKAKGINRIILRHPFLVRPLRQAGTRARRRALALLASNGRARRRSLAASPLETDRGHASPSPSVSEHNDHTTPRRGRTHRIRARARGRRAARGWRGCGP